MKTILFALIILTTFVSGADLEGTWKLQSYSTIDQIKKSPAYLSADDVTRGAMDAQFDTMLENGQYSFGPGDTLHYTDIQGTMMVTRRALYAFSNDTLYIKEIDRAFEREAFVHQLSADSLVISPIVQGKVGNGKMVFTRAK